MSGSVPQTKNELLTAISDYQSCSFSFDPATDSAVHEVVAAVAILEGVDHLDMPPLRKSVNPEALEQLFTPDRFIESTEGVELSFSYAGHDVTVSGDGEIVVE